MMRKLRLGMLGLTALAGAMLTNQVASAATAYTLEGPPALDGFGPNGGGVSVTADTIGATNGPTSMKVSVVKGATFVGALTGNVTSPIGDPPGIKSILFDMTIAPGQEFTGGFAVVGVTVFGASQPDFPGGQLFGLQAQFADFEHIGGKAAGTHTVQIDLASATNQTNFSTGSFNDIFGQVGDGQNVQIPTGFQLFFNKSNDQPLTVYIDNIRTIVPEPTTGLLLGAGAIAIGIVSRRRKLAA